MFLESIFVEKSGNFKNSVLPCFRGSVAGVSSRGPQSLLRWSLLATCSRVEGPVASSLRDFRGSARDSLAGRPSSREKHLENFSKFCSCVFWRLELATVWRLTPVAKIACFVETGAVFKIFYFPSIFL